MLSLNQASRFIARQAVRSYSSTSVVEDRIVVAVGGNALQRRGERLTIENMLKAAAEMAPTIAELASKHELVLTHGMYHSSRCLRRLLRSSSHWELLSKQSPIDIFWSADTSECFLLIVLWIWNALDWCLVFSCFIALGNIGPKPFVLFVVLQETVLRLVNLHWNVRPPHLMFLVPSQLAKLVMSLPRPWPRLDALLFRLSHRLSLILSMPPFAIRPSSLVQSMVLRKPMP